MGVNVAVPGLLFQSRYSYSRTGIVIPEQGLLIRSWTYYHLGKRRTERMKIWRFTGLKDEVRMGGFVEDVMVD